MKIILGILIVIILGAGAWLFFMHDNGIQMLPGNTASSSVTSVESSSIAANPPKGRVHMQYVVANPNLIIVIDPLGKRTGIDTEGKTYTEIPQSSYFPNGVPGQAARSVLVYDPMPGKYTIQVVGVVSGTYALDTDIFNGQNSLPTPTYSGSIRAGQIITYTQNYDPNNLASSTIVLQ